VWVVSVFFEQVGERETRCKERKKNLFPLPAAHPGEEDDIQCRQNGIVLSSFFLMNSE